VIEFLTSLDHSLFLFINRDLANPVFDVFFTTITNGRFWIIPGILLALVYGFAERRKAVVALSLAVLTVALSDPICCKLIKEWVHRLRPCNPLVLIDGGRFLLGHKTSLSFPSAHAMNMFAQAMLFSLLYPRRWLWFFIFAFLIGFSRVYVGVHYPLDVLAGAVLGMGIGAGVYYGYRAVSVRVSAWRQRKASQPRLE
jgi:undecaprenyl-diphosphatase